MNKLIYSIAVAAVVVPTLALASPGDDGCIGNCPQGGNGGGPTNVDVSNEQHQGQLQGQSQESYNANLNKNYNDSSAVSDSNASASSDSSATGVGFGGSSTVGVAVKTGPTVSGSFSNASGGKGGDGGDSYARGGDATARGGDADSRSYSEGGSVGDTTAVAGPSVSGASVGDTTTGDVRSSVGVSIADNSSYSVEYQEASARAANVYTAVCQNGGSAQGVMGGFGVTNQDVVCEHLKIASFMREAYVWELEYGHSAQCAGPMDIDHKYNEAEWADTCFSDKAMEYYKAYHEHMTEAIQAMEAYEEAGLMDKIAGALVRPLALIGALVWLI